MNYKEGKREGERLRYYDSEQLRLKGNYKDGKREGEFLSYWKNGQLWYKNIHKSITKLKHIKLKIPLLRFIIHNFNNSNHSIREILFSYFDNNTGKEKWKIPHYTAILQ